MIHIKYTQNHSVGFFLGLHFEVDSSEGIMKYSELYLLLMRKVFRPMDYIRSWVIHKSFTRIILKPVMTVICIPEVPNLNLGQRSGFSNRLFPISVQANITLIWATGSIIHEYPFFVAHHNSHIIHSMSHNSAVDINNSNLANADSLLSFRYILPFFDLKFHYHVYRNHIWIRTSTRRISLYPYSMFI